MIQADRRWHLLCEDTSMFSNLEVEVAVTIYAKP